jgi:CRP/FNR family cyclic AMP-dependent transcriptional regulator
VVKKIRRSELLAFLEKYGQASMLAAKALSEEYKSAFFDARRRDAMETICGSRWR